MTRTAILLCLWVAAAWATGQVSWTGDVLDTSGQAKSSSLRVDRDGNLHVAFTVDDGSRHPLKYGFWDQKIKKWFVMQVAEGVSTCSLVLDSNQRPHISYVDHGTASGSKLRYMFWDGAKWQKEVLPLSSDIIAYFNSLTLDSQNRPSITFYEYRGPKDSAVRIRLRNVSKAAGYWQVRTVDPQEGSGKFNCTATDSQDRMFISYANVASGTTGLRFATWKDGLWRSEVVETGEGSSGDIVGYSVCLSLDAAGNPHIAYSNASRPGIRYATRKDGKWGIWAVEALSSIGYPDRNGIAVGPDGRPYLTYFDAGRGELRLAYPAAAGQMGRWVAETIDSGGAGFCSSVQIHEDTLYVSYGDGAKGTMKVARRPLPGNVSLVGTETAPRASAR